MQIAALNPKFIAEKDVPADFIEKETEILTVQAKNDPKQTRKHHCKNDRRQTEKRNERILPD